MSGCVLIVGATSAIGRAFVSELCRRGHDLILAGRAEEELERVAADARLRFGTRVDIEEYDAEDTKLASEFSARVVTLASGRLVGVILCHGHLPAESEVRTNLIQVEKTVRINFTSSVVLLEQICPHVLPASRGFICVITSVAGDRGRPSNGLYGSSKGALALYVQALRARLASRGVAVVTVKPGFADTRMTWGLPGLFLVASPEKIARDALRGKDRNRAVVYTPGFWRLVMWIIRSIPDRIFNRLNL